MADIRPKAVDIGESRPNSAQLCPARVEFGPSSAEVEPKLATAGRIRPGIGRTRPTWPISIDVGPTSPGFGQIWAEFGRRSRPHLGRVSPPHRLKFTQLRPHVCFGWRWALKARTSTKPGATDEDECRGPEPVWPTSARRALYP